MENKTSNLVLSICLATCNQSKSVKRFFESMIPQFNSGINQQIEIVVRDDSTNSETENLIENYLKKIPVSIRYFKGKKEGLDTAIIFLTQKAKGNYVWWFGDDILVGGALDYVLRIIKQYPDISFIWVNSRDINNKNDIAIKLKIDKFFEDNNQILKTDIGLLAFISATIFKREKALSGIEGAKKHIGSALVCFYLILHVLSQDGRFYFLHYPYILSNPKPSGESRWYDSFQVFGINLFNITKEFSKKFERASIKKALADNFGRAWRAVVVERAMGFTTGFGSKAPKIKQMFGCYWNYPEFWIALPLFLMPRFILRVFYKIYKFFKQQPHRLLFRKFFLHKTKVDFPAGYIPNRFFLSRIDRGPVLVVGDYAGRDYPAIKEKIKETYLLDIVDNGIADNNFFIQQSIAEPIKFPDNYFQYVVIAEVIEHVWEDKIALKELHRILSPKGKLLMSVPLFHDFASHHYHIYSPKTISTLLEHSGFSMVEAQYRGLTVAVPNGIIALAALLLFPLFGEKALLRVNNFFYRLHLLFSGWEKFNSIFRFRYPFLRGYGVLIEAVKSNKAVDSVQVQKDSFQL